MPITSTSSTIPNQTRNTKPRNQKQQKSSKPISATDPMYSIVPAPRSKSTISSLLLTPFSPTSPTHDHPTTSITKKNKFTSFRGLGCRATSQVSIRLGIVEEEEEEEEEEYPSCMAAPDVWCGPGIGLTTDATSVDCVVSTRPLSAEGEIMLTRLRPGSFRASRLNPRDTCHLPPATCTR